MSPCEPLSFQAGEQVLGDEDPLSLSRRKTGSSVTPGGQISAGLPAVVHAAAVSRRCAHISLNCISRRILRSHCASSMSRSGRAMSAEPRQEALGDSFRLDRSARSRCGQRPVGTRRASVADAPHPRTNAGFFDFNRCRLLPLQYRLPTRFDTIPQGPSHKPSRTRSRPQPPELRRTDGPVQRRERAPRIDGPGGDLASVFWPKGLGSPCHFIRLGVGLEFWQSLATVRKRGHYDRETIRGVSRRLFLRQGRTSD